MRIPSYKTWAIGLFILALWAPVTKGQQQPTDNSNPSQSGPIPAYHSPLAGAADSGESDENPQELAPDTHALAGVQPLTLGIPTTRTYWQPSFSYTGTADSNPVVDQTSGGSWTGWSALTGTIDVHRISGNNNLDLTYMAGGLIAVDGPGGSGIVQELSAVDAIAFRRWNLSLIEQLSYLPPAGYGLGGVGLGGLGGVGGVGGVGGIGGLPPLNPGLGPGQTLLTTLGQSLSSSSDVEVDTKLTGRTSLTFVGGYSLLRYFDNSLLDFGNVNVRAGYNYQWTRKDTLAAVYSFSAFRYDNYNQSINSHTAQISYGRRMTGRLAFQAAMGPQISTFLQPIPTGGTGSAGSQTMISWSANAALQYQLKRGAFGVSYSHGLSGGSGVLAGAITDTLSGTLSRQITRTVSGGVSSGYSRNHGASILTSPTTASAQTYDYWSAGGTLSQTWGRSLSLNFSYQMQYQTSGTEFCLGVACGTSYFRNLISVGLSWRERPLLF